MSNEDEDQVQPILAKDGVTSYLPGTVCVTFVSDVSPEEIREILTAHDCRIQNDSEDPSGLVLVVVPAGKDEELIEAFEALPQVVCAMLNTLAGSAL